MNIKSSLLVKFAGSEGAGGAISLAPSVHGVLVLGILRKYFDGRTSLLTSCLCIGLWKEIESIK